MANPEHVELVRQGAEAIAAWRETHRQERLDLPNADLRFADLSVANLHNANLRHADLRDANLSDADLRNTDLSGAKLSVADLRNANLRNVNLREADLRDANLRNANLRNANLRAADLSVADLRAADLRNADLRNADLSVTNLHNANLSDADLSAADLSAADLRNADLAGAAINRRTKFDDVFVNGETKGLGPWIFNPDKYIIREIEFPPEYRQAGIGIMNYFAEVMRQKYPDIPATVQITQDDLTVRMTIETDEGHRETVEQTLEEYGLVVAKKIPPSALLDNRDDILALEHKLELKDMELRFTHQLLENKNEDYQKLEARVSTLEEQLLETFQQQRGDLSESFRHSQRLNARLVNTSSNHTSEFTQLFRDLLDRPDASADAVQDALATIQQTLESIDERQEVADAERATLIESVRTLSDQSPTVLRQLAEAVPNVSSGIVANVISGVLQIYGLMPGA